MFIAILAVTTLAIFSCNKTGDAPAINNITGTWKYVGYSGGLAGVRFTTDNAQERYIQADTAALRILISYNGQQDCSGYTFEPNPFACTVPGVTLVGQLTLGNTALFNGDNRFNVSIIHDTLVVASTTCIDCNTSYYVPTSKHFDWCSDTTTTK